MKPTCEMRRLARFRDSTQAESDQIKVAIMVPKVVIPVIAVLLMILAFGRAFYTQIPDKNPPPPVTPSTSPFGNTVAGEGMVEPSTEASGSAVITVGTQLPGIVVKIPIHINEEVKAGQLLFELDRRANEAELAVREAALHAAETQLSKLQLQPRPEEVPPAEALVNVAEATVRQQEDLYERDQKLIKTKTITEQEFVDATQALLGGRGQLAQAKANLALLKAGAWEPDKIIAQAAIKQAQAQVAQQRTQLELMQVRAPVDGTILQINIRAGEYLSVNAAQTPVLMGNLNPIHVRVNIDEEDLPRLKLNAPAKAKLRGSLSGQEVDMTFVRLEPYVVPKVSMTGINIERVDTRVIQVIYAIDPEAPLVKARKILVGQLLDVFINTE
jgi:HlyD family secretion protein